MLNRPSGGIYRIFGINTVTTQDDIGVHLQSAQSNFTVFLVNSNLDTATNVKIYWLPTFDRRGRRC